LSEYSPLIWPERKVGTVRDQRAYLVRITTRQPLTRLRTLRRRKESCVGPWLPEPLLTAPDVAEDVELADSVSMAMLLVLETLMPTERVVFVLREVFELAYDCTSGAGPSSWTCPQPGKRSCPSGPSPGQQGRTSDRKHRRAA
jgi:RNA polymerase sigma-70 factor (ECF subfamily)